MGALMMRMPVAAKRFIWPTARLPGKLKQAFRFHVLDNRFCHEWR